VSNFELYYWPVPFRGQFIRAILAYAGEVWDEHDPNAIGDLMGLGPAKQPIAFMGPPLLIDKEHNFAISQMSAIAVYLGERFDLLPTSPEGRALTAKVANDANDIIDELTLNGGQQMWTAEKWEEFVPRLVKWMLIFQAIGEKNALTGETGYMLGTKNPGVADLITCVLWTTMCDRFPVINDILTKTAPTIWGLCNRLRAFPALAELSKMSAELYGEEYCGGDIEKSLRKIIG
jgi:glutathione S-transferase